MEQNTCKISVCLNKAEENGYCSDHQDFAEDKLPSRSATTSADTDYQSPPLTFVLAIVLYLAAIGCAIYGVYTMFTYGDYDDEIGHIVGGDAYNYIIIGIRGSGLIGVGVLAAIIGTGLLLYNNRKKQ